MKPPALGHLLGYTALTVILTAGAAQSLTGANTVTTDDIVDGAITYSKIKTNALTGAKIADGSIATADLKNGAVNSSKIAPTAWQGISPAADCQTVTGAFCTAEAPNDASFSNVGGDFAAARFRRDATGVVTLQGYVSSSGTGLAPVVVLPPGYRPSGKLTFSVACSIKDNSMPANRQSGAGRIDVSSNGKVEFQDDAAMVPYCDAYAPDGWISLSGISFPADP